jgi:8-oxo-dGTP pyrophosphatase MutT (NUDIX family)
MSDGLTGMSGMTRRYERPAARVVVVDDDGHVFLWRIVDPMDDKPPLWITPGGGIERGETPAEAAARELREETGIVVDPAVLGAPIAVARGDWSFRGIPLTSVDWYFALRLPRFEPSLDGLEAIERVIHVGWDWWHPDALDTAPEIILPSGLADLTRTIALGHLPTTPTELPWLTV